MKEDFEILRIPIFEKYKYCLIKFKPMNQNESLSNFGKKLKKHFNDVMKLLDNADGRTPFNFAFGNDWLFIILRKNECSFGGISMNGLGCLGSVLVKNR